MPLYNFKCKGCGFEFRAISSPFKLTEVRCKKCDSYAEQKPVLPTEVAVRVLLDKRKNKAVLRNINKIMHKRSDEYTRKYGLGEFIERVGLKEAVKISKHFDKKTGKLKK